MDYRARFGLALAFLAQRNLAAFGEHLEKAIHVRPEFFCPLPDWNIRLDKATLQSQQRKCLPNGEPSFCFRLRTTTAPFASGSSPFGTGRNRGPEINQIGGRVVS